MSVILASIACSGVQIRIVANLQVLGLGLGPELDNSTFQLLIAPYICTVTLLSMSIINK